MYPSCRNRYFTTSYMSASLFTGFQNSKKKLPKLLLSVIFAVFFIITVAVLLIGIDSVRDIYPESISNIHPSSILQPQISFHPEINYYGLMIYSAMSVSTKNTSSQVSSWYAEKGWEPLGMMWQNGKKYRIGKLTLSIFKVMELNTDSGETEVNGQSFFGISESYEICYCDRR
jgi:hypothetical protein